MAHRSAHLALAYLRLMVNSWFPSWLEGRRPKKTAFTYVDWIGYKAPPAATVTPGGTP